MSDYKRFALNYEKGNITGINVITIKEQLQEITLKNNNDYKLFNEYYGYWEHIAVLLSEKENS